MLRPLEGSSFVLVTNGFADGPAQALRDYLVSARVPAVTVITHPLVMEGPAEHEVCLWRRGELVGRRRTPLPSRPPLTYPIDLLVPVWPPAADGWLGFNALACWRGLAARSLRRASRVAYWCVDYVDDRFGRSPITWAYEAMDGLCCRRADVRFEVSRVALEARDRRHAGARRLSPACVVPMGAWLSHVPKIEPDAYARRKVVYLGHLVPRQGVSVLIDAVALLHANGVDLSCDVVGGGPLESELRRRSRDAGLDGLVTFHGFVKDHRDVERILAGGSVAVAPYDTEVDSFTRFADPGKLKAYLGAGLPIVLTDVPPNAAELAEAGAAETVSFSAEAVAAAIERLLGSPEVWRRRRAAALRVAAEYDWDAVLPAALREFGFAA